MSPLLLPSARNENYFEQLLGVVFENATLAIIIMDKQQRCAYMNAAAERLTGYTLAEAVGRIMHDVIHHTRPDGRPYPLAECPIDRAFPQNSREQGEDLFVHKNGHFYPVAFTASPIRVGDDILGTVIELRDIAEEQRVARERIQTEIRLRHLQQVTSSFAETQTLAEVRQIILNDVLSALGADGGSVQRVMGQGLVVDEYDLGSRMNEDDLRRYGYLPLTTRHPAVDAVQSGEAVFISDAQELIQRYPDLAATVTRQETQATVQLPLKRGEVVFGVLGMSFPGPRIWDEAERDFALTLAERASVSYERARLFEAEQRARERIERLQSLTAQLATALAPGDVVQAVLEEGLPVLGSNTGSVVQIDGEDLVIVGSTGYPAELLRPWQRFPISASTPLGEAVRTGEAVWLESQAEFLQRFGRLPDPTTLAMSRSWAALPMVAYGRIVGGLALSYREPQTFDVDTRRFAKTLTDLCAQALERSRLFASEREARQRLEETTGLLGQALDAAGMVAWNVVDDQLRLSRNTALILGSDVAHVGTPTEATANIHPDDLDHKIEAFRQAVEHHSDYHTVYRFWNNDRNEWLWLEDHGCVHNRGDTSPSISGVTQDITERKRAEAALRDAQAERLVEAQQHAERLRQLNAASLRLNAATTRNEVLSLVATTARELIGAHQSVSSMSTDHGWAQAMSAKSLSEKYAQWKNYDTKPDGSGIYALVCRTNTPLRMTQAELEAHPAWKGFGSEAAHHSPMRGWLAVPLAGRDGRNIGLIQLSDKYEGEFSEDDQAILVQLAQIASVALENQALYEQEQAARAQVEEASRLKDDFLATVSHELRTPLTALLGYAQLLQMRQRDAAYIARTVEKMVHSAKAQAQLVEDLLDVSRIVSGKLRIDPQPINLINVVHAALDTVRPAIETKGLQLQLDLNPEAGMVIGDANRLQQVMWNLLSNATKFTPPGGIIRVRLQLDNRDAQLSVDDTGPGISAAFLPYVFDRFRQADSASNRAYNGLGLGLAIVRHLVELHGGTVHAASAGEGQGAMFTVRLPVISSSSATTSAGATSGISDAVLACPPELRGLRVLLVDDQPDILELLHEVLTPCGVVVRMCNTAQQALTMLREWQPDVLVSDIAMPGEDGYWLIRHVRALAPSDGGTIPAVALTAYVRMEDRVRVLAAGFQRYVPKPVEPGELLEIVASLAHSAEEL